MKLKRIKTLYAFLVDLPAKDPQDQIILGEDFLSHVFLGEDGNRMTRPLMAFDKQTLDKMLPEVQRCANDMGIDIKVVQFHERRMIQTIKPQFKCNKCEDTGLVNNTDCCDCMIKKGVIH